LERVLYGAATGNHRNGAGPYQRHWSDYIRGGGGFVSHWVVEGIHLEGARESVPVEDWHQEKSRRPRSILYKGRKDEPQGSQIADMSAKKRRNQELEKRKMSKGDVMGETEAFTVAVYKSQGEGERGERCADRIERSALAKKTMQRGRSPPGDPGNAEDGVESRKLGEERRRESEPRLFGGVHLPGKA